MNEKGKSEKLDVVNIEKAIHAAELVIANAENVKHAHELIVAEKKLIHQKEEKAKREAELVLANIEKAKRAAELVIADIELLYQKEEKVKREAELVLANIEKAKRAAELVIADKELIYQKEEKVKREAELVIANKELSYQKREKAKRAAELIIAKVEKAKQTLEIVNEKIEKAKRAAALVVTKKELLYQKREQEKQALEIVIEKIEKAKRAAALVVTKKELVLAKEKEKLAEELIILNKELSNQISVRKLAEEKLLQLNHELKTTYEKLAHFSSLISESVDYAKKIQNSIIPDYKKFFDFFPDSFILTKPKNVLSGDFFWSHNINNKITFAIVDCTGHGIPGALLSVIGIILLNKVVIEKVTISPTEILDSINKELMNLFNAGNEMVDDGMEISIISYDKLTKEMIIAQTSKSVLIIDPDGTLTTFDSDIFTIGGVLSGNKTTDLLDYSYQIKSGSMMYLFSDGYIDQFGSDLNIKYGIQKFHEQIKTIYKLPAQEQLEILLNSQLQWKGNMQQTDDITVIGIKF
jgi:serine phosphatase RsbU (regulator of sigma subunit)